MASLNIGLRTRAEVQLQSEAAECGLACLAMISSINGREVGLRELRQQFSTSLMGITLEQLASNAHELGFISRALRLDIHELNRIVLPCILHVDMNHFVVLNRIEGAKFEILDPATGRRRITAGELSTRFTGVALELTPEQGFLRQRKQKADISIRNLLGPVKGLASSLSKIFILSVAIEIFAILGPFLNQWAVDEAIVSGDLNLLFTIGAGFVLACLLQSATETVRELALINLSAALNVQWFARICARLLRLPTSYFEKRQIGDIIARVDTINSIQSTVSNGLIEGIVDGIMAIGTFAMMVLYSAKLATISIVALTI